MLIFSIVLAVGLLVVTYMMFVQASKISQRSTRYFVYILCIILTGVFAHFYLFHIEVKILTGESKFILDGIKLNCDKYFLLELECENYNSILEFKKQNNN